METAPASEPRIRVGPQHQVNDVNVDQEQQPETEKDIYVRTTSLFSIIIRVTQTIIICEKKHQKKNLNLFLYLEWNGME
jgi:hypothetical protein